jgi:hypothetical protein
LADGNYQWRVIARDNYEHGAWSDTWSFTIDTDKPIANTPNAPGLYNNTGYVNWTWSPSEDTGSGILGYYVNIGTIAGGTDVVNNAWTENNWYNLSGLKDGYTYYCKIKAKNGARIIGDYSKSSEGIMVDVSPPTNLSMRINNGDEYTDTEFVTLSLEAEDWYSGVDAMRFSLDNLTWSDWEPYNTSKDYILPIGDGQKTIYFEVRDLVGNIAPAHSDSILLDTTPPYDLSIEINNGTYETKTTSVMLTLNAIDNGSGVAEMRFSTNGYSWGDWEPFKMIQSYEISSEDGLKSVYFRVKDALGHIAEPVFDTIILNTTQPPIDTDEDGIPDTKDFDDDNDWIPDEWEQYYGFNITNSSDAYLDPDNDKLTNLDEYLNKTDPLNPDTDNDGLLDGDEVLFYHTNATNPDTDGDGFEDGYEVAVDTDPLDENDYPRAKKKKQQEFDYAPYIVLTVIIIIVILAVLFLRPKPVPKIKKE